MNRTFKVGLAVAAAVSGTAAVLAYALHSLSRVARIKLEDDPSRLDLRYETVSFRSIADGVLLRGWYIGKEKGDRCVILTHGSENHRADPAIGMLEIASRLVERGYDVLLYDLRGHGESGRGRITGGCHERRDVLGAVEYMKGRGFPPESIGLLGFSLGAAASLLAAAEDSALPAVVSDSCWADMRTVLEHRMGKSPFLPKQFSALLPFAAKHLYGIDFANCNPLRAVERVAPRPIFFIHGEFDDVIPVEHAMKLYRLTENPGSKMWVVPEAGHVQCFSSRPEEYIDRVATFFDQALKASSRPGKARKSKR